MIGNVTSHSCSKYSKTYFQPFLVIKFSDIKNAHTVFISIDGKNKPVCIFIIYKGGTMEVKS